MPSAPHFSFEFFPPKTDKAAAQLHEILPELAVLGPRFMTVTYGAGGSTRDGTRDTLMAMRTARPALPLASHLTFINTRREDLHALTDGLWNDGIRHIVALRGDMPGDLSWPLNQDGGYFQYTSDFVAALKGWNGFEISVACYPEKHPDAASLDADIAALKQKCDAGADRAITQFFFDNDVFYRFVDKCRAAGIDTPICPGLLPVHDYQSMTRFAARCQASIPAWVHEKFAAVDGRPDAAKALAEDMLFAQTEDLLKHGVTHIHFYTLNKAEITRRACQAFAGTV